MTTTTVPVLGMTCAHCAAAVTEEISAIAGVTGVTVDLHPAQESIVTVTSDAELAREVLAAAIDEAGYELAS